MWVMFTPLAPVPSPKSQMKSINWPSESNDEEASNRTLSPGDAHINRKRDQVLIEKYTSWGVQNKLKQELDQRVKVPSLNNAWLMPIRTRIDMQSTGINTPIGLKISGPDLKVIQGIGKDVELIIRKTRGEDIYKKSD